MFSIDIDDDIIINLKEIDISKIIPHEKTSDFVSESFKNKLKSQDDFKIIPTIIICSQSLMIIDGHHRYIMLKEMGYKKAPVTIINYFSNSIVTDPKMKYSKELIISNAKQGNIYEPKSTKHLIFCKSRRKWFPIMMISSWYCLS